MLAIKSMLQRGWQAVGNVIGLEPRAHYDAGRQGHRMRGWNPSPAGPNLAIENLDTIRSRARDAVRNEWAGAKGAQVWATNLVGTGIVPRPQTTNARLKSRLDALWAEWVPLADADGLLDFYALQTLAVRSWITAGELFVRFRARRPGDGLAVPLQIQLLESEMCPLLDWDTAPGMPAGNRIKSGIEISPIGRRVAYWMYREHPGDRSTRASLADLVRVPADQVRHIFEPGRPGQLRGVSDFSTVLTKLRGVLDYDDAQLERQRLANMFTMFVTRNSGEPNIDPVTGKPIQYDNDGQAVAAMFPGMSVELNPGEDVRFSEPPGAGAGYSEFIKQQLMGVAAGQGLPYELLTGDLGAVSDRALRVILQEFRRHAEQRQWQVVIPMFCEPIRGAWLRSAVLAGLIGDADYADARGVTWQPHGWAYLHPVQDVQGKALEVQYGFRSRASVVAERGDEVAAVDHERAADRARSSRLGLDPLPEKSGQDGRNTANHAQRASSDTLARGSAEIMASISDMMDRKLSALMQHAPSVTVNNAVQPAAAPEVTVTNHVAPTPVEITNQVQPVLPEVIVTNHVAPTPVEITNQVQPASIAEISIVSMPTRETSTIVERDTSNRIVNTVQIDRDVE